MFTWKEKEFYNQIENHMVQNIHNKNTYIIIGHIEYKLQSILFRCEIELIQCKID
jgi:mRNA-degrading endonuclease HigB of HigAB toxin-antitoxin module